MALTAASAVGAAWGTLGLTFFFVGIRLYIDRSRGSKRFTLSGYISIVYSFVLLIPTIIATLTVKPATDVKVVEFRLKSSVPGVLLFIIVMWLIKASLVALYREFSNKTTRRLYLLWVTLAIYVGTTFCIAVLGTMLSCRPLSNVWTSKSSVHYCPILNTTSLLAYYFATISTDITIIAYPAILLHTLKAKRETTIAVAFVIFIGSISVIATTVRFALLWPLLGAGPDSAVSQRLVSTSYAGTFWSQMEILFAMLASCLPSFRLLLRRPQRHFDSSPSSGSTWAHFDPRKRRMEPDRGLGTSNGSENFIMQSYVSSNADRKTDAGPEL